MDDYFHIVPPGRGRGRGMDGAGVMLARRPEKQQQVLGFAQDNNIYFDEVLRFAQDDSFYF